MRTDLFKGVVLGAVVAAVVLTAATAMAGTGIGSVFNLGKTNKANATSTIQGTTSHNVLQLTNRGSGAALGLKVAAGKAPLAVNSDVTVKNLSADKLDGIDSTGFTQSGGLGSVAAVASWYAPQLIADPTFVQPNRYGGEDGWTANGGSLLMTKEGTGWYRMKIDPALPGQAYLLFANADSWGSTPLYAQGSGPFAGPVWDIYVHDKNGNAADAYYIEILLVRMH
jgi:predicted RecA/RadA family phage recombinase